MLALFRGYNIGIRLVDEFLAKAQITACQHFSETAEVIAKVHCPAPTTDPLSTCKSLIDAVFFTGRLQDVSWRERGGGWCSHRLGS